MVPQGSADVPTASSSAMLPPPAAPTSAPAAAPSGALPVFPPSVTLAQILAHAALQAPTQAVQEQQASSDAAARAQAASITGYMSALAPLLQHIAPAVQQGYTQAAGMDALLGKGFADETSQQQGANTGQANQILGLSGAPPGQHTEVGQAIGGPGVANALGWLNGGLPATGLEQAGAAYGAAAKALPAEFAGQGLEQIQSLQAKQGLADQGYAQKVADIQARYPDLFLKSEQQVTKDQQTAANDQSMIDARTAATKINAAKVGIAQQVAADRAAYQRGELSARDFSNKIQAARAQTAALDAEQRTAIARANAVTSRMNAQTSRSRVQAVTTPKFSSSTSRSLGYRADQFGNPILVNGSPRLLPGFGFDAKGDIVKTSTSSTTKVHGFTPAQLTRMRSSADNIAASAFHGAIAKSGKALPPVSYEEAINEERNAGYPLWLAVPIVNGYYKAGGRNSPLYGPPTPGLPLG